MNPTTPTTASEPNAELSPRMLELQRANRARYEADSKTEALLAYILPRLQALDPSWHRTEKQHRLERSDRSAIDITAQITDQRWRIESVACNGVRDIKISMSFTHTCERVWKDIQRRLLPQAEPGWQAVIKAKRDHQERAARILSSRQLIFKAGRAHGRPEDLYGFMYGACWRSNHIDESRVELHIDVTIAAGVRILELLNQMIDEQEKSDATA